MSKSAQALFEEREKRVHDAIACKVPDRVPLLPFFGAFASQYGGITRTQELYDIEKSLDAAYKTTVDFEPDMACPTLAFGPVMETLDYKQLKWSGRDLNEDGGYQFVDGEYMKADEYEALMYDPTDFIIRSYWPRVFGKLGGFGNMPPLRQIISYYMGGYMGFMPFAMPPGEEALTAMKKAGEESAKVAGATMEYMKKIEAAGFPLIFSGGTQAPFDTLSDFFRGTRYVMMDMFRYPDKVIAATEKLLPMMIEAALGIAKMSGNPRVFIPLHKGQEGFMSPDQYDRFYWPTFKALLEALVDHDLNPMVLAEGSYTARLDNLRELPEGKIVFWFEEVDMAKAKEKLGGRVCIMGNVPMSLLVGGTPDEVRDYCKKIIDIAGKDGGFIMSAAAVMDKAKTENVRAMMEATRQYGVY